MTPLRRRYLRRLLGNTTQPYDVNPSMEGDEMEVLVKLTEDEQDYLLTLLSGGPHNDLDEALVEKIRRARDTQPWDIIDLDAPREVEKAIEKFLSEPRTRRKPPVREYMPQPGDQVKFPKVSENIYTIVHVEDGWLRYRFEGLQDYMDTLENCRKIGMTKVS
jgi:hypothetical protein